MTERDLRYKNVFRCNAISAVDGFLPVRDVLKYEMFGDEGDKGFRNFDGVLDDLKRLIPGCDDHFMEMLFESIQTEQLEYDDEYRYNFTDFLIKLLISECKVPEEYFNYGIWACESPEDVVDSYNVNSEDVSKYKIKGVMLQDLGEEGALYGCKDYPEEVFDESVAKKTMIFNDEEFEQIFNECVTAGGMGGCINNFVPQNVLAVTDTKMGAISPGVTNGKILKSGENPDFENNSMKVYKKGKKKGDAITGTGIVYAKDGKLKESSGHVMDDEDLYEYERDYGNTECSRCGADCSEYGVMIRGDIYCRSCAESEMRDDDDENYVGPPDYCPRCGKVYDLHDNSSYGIAKGHIWCATCAEELKRGE